MLTIRHAIAQLAKLVAQLRTMLLKGGPRAMAAAFVGVPAVLAFAQAIRSALSKHVQLHWNAKDARSRFLIDSTPALATYSPPFWMGGDLQTLWGVQMRPRPECAIEFTRRYLQLADGGMIALDWLSKWQPGQPLLLLLHGLTGGSQENYIQHMAAAAEEHGYCVVVQTARGCNETELVTAKGFSACWTADVRASTRFLRRTVGDDTPFFAAGVSLGGSILARFLVEEGSACTLQGAALLCPSLDMRKSSQLLNTPLNRLTYNRVLAGSLARYAKRHESTFKLVPAIPYEQAVNATTVHDFDAAVVVPSFGFDDVEHYYCESTTGPLLERHVGIPTLIAHAADDPICCPTAIPVDAHRANPNIIVAMTSTGGHVAWLQGMWPQGRSWVDEPLAQFFDAIQAWNKDPAAQQCHLRARSGIPFSDYSDTVHSSNGPHGEDHLAAVEKDAPLPSAGDVAAQSATAD